MQFYWRREAEPLKQIFATVFNYECTFVYVAVLSVCPSGPLIGIKNFVCFQTRVYTLGEFHKNRNNSTVFEELSMSIGDLTVANIRFTGSTSRRFIFYKIR
jgi:hypothetical protein